MRREQWEAARELFHHALDLSPAERSLFLNDKCQDSEIRAEVEALLAGADDYSQFLETPPVPGIGHGKDAGIANPDRSDGDARSKAAGRLCSGDQLGPYRIVSFIAAGGMGDIYEALDIRLRRKVALKFLPLLFAQEPDRAQRFVRETRALAALNHPNIITIYDVSQDGGRNFIVMELVDGSPLSELIPTHGMKLTNALRIAVQIADSLEAAHANGIVHRDLKPSNIMLDRKGRVKVLDFGLAKQMGGSTAGYSTEAWHVTKAGLILGSVPYMSPEQAEGRPVDARSDIFSFGVVLYEMITGQKAFKGESPASTLAAVLLTDPRPPSEISRSTPPELDRLILRCLRKDVNKRSQTISDVKLAIEELAEELETGNGVRPSPSSPRQRRFSRQWWLWSAVFGVVVAGALAWTYRSRTTGTTLVPGLIRLSPDDGYSYSEPAISADGKLVTYISDRSGKAELWLQQVGGDVPIQLTHSRGQVAKAAFFPDGTRILYLTTSPKPQGPAPQDPALRDQDTLEIISTLGGEPHVIFSGSLPTIPRLPTFSISPDGHQIAYVGAQPHGKTELMIRQVDTDQTRSLNAWQELRLESGVFVPVVQWTADGHWLLCMGSKRPDAKNLDDWDWFVIPADGGKPVSSDVHTRLRAGGFGFTFPTSVLGNHWFFVGPNLLNGHVWQIDVTPGSWRMDGNPQQLSFGTEDEAATSLSAGGLAAIQSARLNWDLYLVPLDRTTGSPSGAVQRLTHDSRGKLIAKTPENPDGLDTGGDPEFAYFSVAMQTHTGYSVQAYRLDLDKRRQAPLFTLPGLTDHWTVSADARLVAYSPADGDRYSIRLDEIGGSLDSARMLCRACGMAIAFSPDRRFLLYDAGRPVRQDPGRKSNVHLMDVNSGEDKIWLEDSANSIELLGFMGRKGEWALVSERVPGRRAAPARNFIVRWRVQPVPRQEWIEVPVTDPRFSAASDFVYFFKGAQLEAVKFDPPFRRFSAPFIVRLAPGSQPVLQPSDSWMVRGPGIVFAPTETRSSVWLMKLPN